MVALVLSWSGGVEGAEPREATVLMLAGNGLSAADRRLIDALRIYTSDVGCRLVLSGEAPPDGDAGALSRIERLARTENADIVVWTSRRSDGGLAFHLLTVRDRDVRVTDVAALGTKRAADSVALKIRSLLSSSVPRASSVPPGSAPPVPPDGAAAVTAPATTSTPPASSPRQPDGGRPSKPEPATGGALSPPAARPEQAPEVIDRPKPVESAISATRVAGPAPAAREPPRVALLVGYDVAAPVDETWVRQGLMLGAEARLGATAFVVHLEGGLSRWSTVVEGQVTGRVRVTPFGLALVRRWSGPRLSVAAGPRIGLHLIDVVATANQSVTDGPDISSGARQLSGGLGAGGSVELTLTRVLTVWLGASAEVLLPARRFTLLGAPVAHTSPALLGAAAGLGISIF
ncbi:MAG TPA: hypothetical protein VIU64_16235 [Polyangia bacterium]